MSPSKLISSSNALVSIVVVETVEIVSDSVYILSQLIPDSSLSHNVIVTVSPV